MKLTIFLLLVGIITSFAAETYSQATKLTLVFSNLSIENALKQIEDQSEFRFFYNGKINVDQTVNHRFNQNQCRKCYPFYWKEQM